MVSVFYSSILSLAMIFALQCSLPSWIFSETPSMEQRLFSNDPNIRIHAYAEVKEMDNSSRQQLARQLAKKLSDPDPSIGQSAYWALDGGKMWLMVPEVIPILLQDFTRYHNGQGSLVLAQFGAPAVPGLIEILKSSDYWMGASAAQTLDWMSRDHRDATLAAVPALITAMKSQPQYNRGAFAIALRDIGTPDAVDAVKKYGSDWAQPTPPDIPPTKDLRIVRPKNGQRFKVGDPIIVIVKVQGHKMYESVEIVGEDMGMSDAKATKTSNLYEFKIIASNGNHSPGDKKITAVGLLGPGEGDFSEPVTIQVEERRR
jgi:hypothetical protein